MYEAPDRYKRMISARLPGGESLGLSQSADEGDVSSPLRDTQLIARGQLAAFFATANAVAALLIATTLLDHVSAGVACGVGGRGRRSSILARCSSRGPRRSPMSAARAARCRTGRWSAKSSGAPCCSCRLPLYYFTALDPNTQVIVASLLAGLGIAALGLVVVPACVTAWMSCFVAGAEPRPGAGARRPSRSSICCRSCSRWASRCSAC